MNRDLITGYNYQKNLDISDPDSLQELGEMKLELDFFENFICITLINAYWMVHESTKELQFEFIDPSLGKQLGFDLEFKNKSEKLVFKKRDGIALF